MVGSSAIHILWADRSFKGSEGPVGENLFPRFLENFGGYLSEIAAYLVGHTVIMADVVRQTSEKSQVRYGTLYLVRGDADGVQAGQNIVPLNPSDSRSRRWSSTARSLGMALLMVVSALTLLSNFARAPPGFLQNLPGGYHDNREEGKLGAVASENAICSRYGTDMLKMGGNAADAVSILPRKCGPYYRDRRNRWLTREMDKYSW